ncbi:MAG TPA: FHA domain-containing protein [Anaeromyxobacteraceae bacterium]|nr:FHA domain-containing protein [Anaeromyxobacteraceae bacterium]
MTLPLRILFENREGRREALPFADGEVSVGRAPGSALRLDDRNVSRHHARFLRQNGTVFVEDLGSSNGTRVNGERIEGRCRIRLGDLVQIGDWDLALEGLPEADPAHPGPAEPAGPAPEAPPAAPLALASPSRRGWLRPATVLLAIALGATLLGYAAGRALRSPPSSGARASR